MATADIDDTLTDERAALAGQPKKHDHEQAVHLDKVTDYVEEQEIFGDVGKVSSMRTYNGIITGFNFRLYQR